MSRGARMAFHLYAEKNGDRTWLAEGGSLDVLKECVEMMESKSIWPEGCEAIAVDISTKKEWHMTEVWEEFSEPQKKEAEKR